MSSNQRVNINRLAIGEIPCLPKAPRDQSLVMAQDEILVAMEKNQELCVKQNHVGWWISQFLLVNCSILYCVPVLLMNSSTFLLDPYQSRNFSIIGWNLSRYQDSAFFVCERSQRYCLKSQKITQTSSTFSSRKKSTSSFFFQNSDFSWTPHFLFAQDLRPVLHSGDLT